MEEKKIRLSATALQQFSECRQLYFLNRVLKKGPAGRVLPLEFGAAMDRAIRSLYLKDWDIAHATEVFNQEYEDDPSDSKRTRETARLIIQRYATAYKNQPIKIIEQGFPFALDVEGTNVEIVGELDRIVEQSGRVMPSEFKTTTQLTADYMKKFWWDVQTAIYLIAARQLIDKKISAVHIDAVLVAKSDPSKLRSAPLLRDIVEHDAEELEYMCTRIKQLIGELFYCHEVWGSGKNDLWYENDQACTARGNCKYLAYCRRGPSVRQQIMRGEFVDYKSDPKRFEIFKDCKRAGFCV